MLIIEAVHLIITLGWYETCQRSQVRMMRGKSMTPSCWLFYSRHWNFAKQVARCIWIAFNLIAIALLVPKGAFAGSPRTVITGPVDESRLVTLLGNTPVVDAQSDLGRVSDTLQLDHLLLVLKRAPEVQADLQRLIDAMHQPGSPQYHHWLTATQLGKRFGVSAGDSDIITRWLKSHGFTVNLVHRNRILIDFSGSAGQVREAFHTELHNIVLANGEQHIANTSDPQVPAALAPAVEGVVSLHDFFPRPHLIKHGLVVYDHNSQSWHPKFTIASRSGTFHVVSPYDFDTIYNVLPLWSRGFTGRGVTIAVVEDSNLAHPSDWSTFRQTFGLDKFTSATFTQIYPNCLNPGQNGDEIEADLDAEWASASAPNANIVLSACANSATGSGLDLAIINLLESSPPDIISDSYGLCETITGQAKVALENDEEEQATAEGVTFFIAQGDTGADECAPVEPTLVSTLGINSGDNTASIYAVGVGGTDFMAQFNSDVSGIPLSNYWSATNNPRTLASALSYIPEIPWNDTCASQLIYSDPNNGSFSQAYGESGFCNSSLGQAQFLDFFAGSGGPSTCFTGAPSVFGVVSGACKGNPKPSFQSGVPGVPNDGERDQPDLALFAADGIWGSFYVECFSDQAQGGAPCTANNDALLEGGGGTSFASPAMAGIQALIDQKFGKQGDANYVYYKLAGEQFADVGDRCNASQTDGGLPSPSCVFNDITAGDIDIPCRRNRDGSYYDCFGAASPIIGELSSSDLLPEPAYRAAVGYDLATGLGSINATNLFDAWPSPK
jgi:subtilase family serine protease